ncbi:MAG: hypothetical protein FJY85_17475, partial [Deltaproteobacteria bacterium]|nr:hypothetical protein [Deltaproteobacteria bacterium]
DTRSAFEDLFHLVWLDQVLAPDLLRDFLEPDVVIRLGHCRCLVNRICATLSRGLLPFYHNSPSLAIWERKADESPARIRS